MEQRWMTGCVRNPIHNISAHYLASSTNIFSDGFIRSLGNDLEFNREQLARELGFSSKQCTANELYNWCNSPGSTVFVLISVLVNLDRTDCVRKIEEYIHSRTMQLFVKVEEATEHRPITGSPLFHQIITSCEFTLLQALENILGEDVVYYEIVGPGSWVMWNTAVEELKGQQLTLVHHSQPVPQTRAALCEIKEPDTELKQPVVTRNIPTTPDVTSNGETYVKTHMCTEMESLKYSQEPSNQVSNSNNISLSGFPDLEKEVLQSLSTETATKTHNHPSVGNKNYQFLSDPHTQVKELIDDKQNTPEYAPVVKHFPDKLLYRDSNSDVHQVLVNVPNLSLLNEEFSSLLPNIQNQPVHPSMDSKTCKSTAEGQTKAKSLIAGSQNTSEYPQIIKHLPDKLLNNDIESKGNNQDLVTIQQVLENVPCLSLLEERFSSLIPDTQKSTLPAVQQEKQDKMNNLNCGAPVSVKVSMNPLVFSKTFGSEATPTSTFIRSAHHQTQSFGYKESKDADPVHSTPVLSQRNLSKVEICQTVSSLLSQGRNIHQINVPADHDCFLNAGPQVDRQFQDICSPLENDSPLLCDIFGVVSTPPQKRHRLGHAAPASSSFCAEPHSQLQQQTLLDVQAMKLKQLQIQQLHQQQQSLVSQTLDNDFTDSNNSQHHLPWPQQQQQQQQQSQCHQDSEAHNHLQLQHNSYIDHNSPTEHFQSLKSDPQEFQHQTLQKLQLPYLQLLLNQEPHQELQTQNSFIKIKPTPFMNLNASPYLICHTPPPGFPDDQTDAKNCREFEEPERLSIRSEIFETAPANQENNPPSHFVGKLGHVMKINTKEYMTMSQPIQHNLDNPDIKPDYFGQFITLQNIEFHDTNPFLSSRKHMRSESRSNSSGISADCPTPSQGEHSAIFFGGQNTFTTPQPFYPAPPIFDALGRRINASVTTCHDILRSNFGEMIQPQQDGYNKRQFSGSKSLNSDHFQATSNGPTNQNLEAELLHLEGWCPHENGDTIKDTMEKFKPQDGNYIIWKSRRFKKLIISVSHLNQLFHFRVDEMKCENSDRVLYYLFEGGYTSDSLLDLVQHYRQSGIRITMQSRGSTKTYIEHIYLRYPLKVKLEMKRKDTFRSK